MLSMLSMFADVNIRNIERALNRKMIRNCLIPGFERDRLCPLS